MFSPAQAPAGESIIRCSVRPLEVAGADANKEAIMVTPSARLFALIAVCLSLGLAASSAGPRAELALAPPRSEGVANPEIDAYIAGLRYEPRDLLAEQAGPDLPPERLPDETNDDGQALVICRQVRHRLGGNLEGITILDPAQGVVWPGALVKVDDDLVRGTPTPIRCRRAPVSLSVDLPGIGGHGVFEVRDPSHGSVQAALDEALDYWNDHQYREGYVSKSRSQYARTFVHSAQQVAAFVGVSYRSLKGRLAAEFQATSSSEKTVGLVLFKQVFYTVSFDPPSHAAAVFHPAVTLQEAQDAFSAEAPPAYVSSVDFGRILMLRIETSARTDRRELEAAMEALRSFRVKAGGSYERALKESRMTLITIGGNAEVNTRAVDAGRIEDLNDIIQGKNALYSRKNPGQPIAYTIRFLKDGRLARIGYSTDYTEVSCERHPHGWIRVLNNGHVRAKVMMRWKEGGEEQYWSSGELAYRKSAERRMKGNSSDVVITGQYLSGLRWREIFSQSRNAPPNRTYVVNGSRWRMDPPDVE
jgi:thiol-activated cytolysin